jgi:hypothetical protein
MNPRQFLELATTLANSPDGSALAEAQHRSAISRAYYAAFNGAVQFLNRIKVSVIDETKAHVSVRMSFITCGEEIAKDIGGLLAMLIRQRKYADYDMDDPGPERKKTATAACEQSREVFKKLDQCQQAPDFESLRSAIRIYAETSGSNLKAF